MKLTWFVFSTCVEVILNNSNVNVVEASILHVCGGDPKFSNPPQRCLLYSPRVWRWSYIDCAIKVFEISILHVCGGDPKEDLEKNIDDEYSPRVWRWSWRSGFHLTLKMVFSTCVEVILSCLSNFYTFHRILHVCGGDPMFHCIFVSNLRYSPRVWRWSSAYL